jgi:hypothetical protein
MCNGDLPLGLSNERRRTLPSIATTPSHCSEKPAMKRRAEPLRFEHAEKRAERVVAGHAILTFEKPARERLLRLGEQAHIDRALPAGKTAHIAIAKIS